MSAIQQGSMRQSMVVEENTESKQPSKFQELQAKLTGILQDPVVSNTIEVGKSVGGVATGVSVASTHVGGIVKSLSGMTQAVSESGVLEESAKSLGETGSTTLSVAKEVAGGLGGAVGIGLGVFNLVQTCKEIKKDLSMIKSLKEDKVEADKKDALEGADANFLDKDEEVSLGKKLTGLKIGIGAKMVKMVAILAQIIAALAKLIQSIINLITGGGDSPAPEGA